MTTTFRTAELDFLATGQLLRLMGEAKVSYFDDPDGAMCGLVVDTSWPRLTALLNDADDLENETDWRPHWLDDEANLRTILERVGRGEVRMLVDADNATLAYVFAERADSVLAQMRRRMPATATERMSDLAEAIAANPSKDEQANELAALVIDHLAHDAAPTEDGDTGYVVTWSMPIDAEHAVDAAVQALGIMQDPHSIATVFIVTDPDGKRYLVDLDPELAADDYEAKEITP